MAAGDCMKGVLCLQAREPKPNTRDGHLEALASSRKFPDWVVVGHQQVADPHSSSFCPGSEATSIAKIVTATFAGASKVEGAAFSTEGGLLLIEQYLHLY